MTQSPVVRDPLPPDQAATWRWQAASRWVSEPSVLHREVAQRMATRLMAWRTPPRHCLDWQPSLGGVLAQGALKSAGLAVSAWIHEPSASRLEALMRRHSPPWWRLGASLRVAKPGTPIDLVWSNLGLHLAHDPGQWLQTWRQALVPGGGVVFSCLGPDTLIELRSLYAQAGWPAPCQDWMDMHDWGDVLLKQGWKDPVMDVERLVFTYTHTDDVLRDLRAWGRNLHPLRFPACRSKGWLQQLRQLLDLRIQESSDRRMRLSFEIVHGHALRGESMSKPHNVQSIPLTQLRSQLPSHNP